MIRRFSSTFRKDRNKNGADVDSTSSPEKTGRAKAPKPGESGSSGDRKDVSSTFNDFAQVLHASQRPLPDRTGDGSYLAKEEPSGLLTDLRSLGFKDVKTLREVFQNKSKGQLVDDKTYIMERVIQLVAGLPSTSKTRVDLVSV
jgi:linoleate 10R-lipoxygenase